MSRYLYSEKLEEKLDQGSEVLTEVKAKLRGLNLDTVGSSTQEPTPQVQTAATVSSSRKTGENNNWGNLPWKKDFKIAGQIGEPGQKDRLSFASLARQIEAGVKKGFSHDDVTEAVIKAIVPGSRLRNYLEGRTTISLPELRSLLRAHFQEKEATTLFQELSTAFQGPKETAHSFVLRTLDLRQKVVFASQEAGAGVIYTYEQAQKMFLHTVSTGLQSDYVRQQLQPLLTQEATTDEALLEALTVFVGQEAERAMKLKKSKVHTTALWDTGAQVSLVSEEWVKQHLPQTLVRPMEDLLDSEGLRLNTATGTPIGFQGWIEVKFQIPNATLTGDEIIVPMLVTEEILETPIIGYNVIEEMAQRGSMKSTQKQFCKLLPQMSYPQVNKLVNMLQTVDSEEMSTVKTKRNSVKVMAGETIIVRCTTHRRAHEEVTTLFEPDENHQLSFQRA
ncbi:hypothetical protein HOLleu_06955 [Holothuria leucospilota]|uniref:Uncharacterized protein n=1 Tax=Holothuria leucospilota TaxID=206669 RepID=A0A9Q1CNN5_HOLLE|nr:hypothetical protein HOLleu_06955 [Holothuria leucospilota]